MSKRKFDYCQPCLENSGIKREATWLLPQSVDASNHIKFIMACDGHHEGWWDGADWDGSCLEVNLVELNRGDLHSPVHAYAPKDKTFSLCGIDVIGAYWTVANPKYATCHYCKDIARKAGYMGYGRRKDVK